MTFLELLDVIVLTSVVTVLLTLFSRRIRARLKASLERYLRPRYLKSCGIRRRAPAHSSQRAPDESV